MFAAAARSHIAERPATSISFAMSTSQPEPITHEVEDPIPDPEPASPSLDEPDPGVFHHDPAKPFPQSVTGTFTPV